MPFFARHILFAFVSVIYLLLQAIPLAQSGLYPVPHWTDPSKHDENRRQLEQAVEQRRLEVQAKLGYDWPHGPLPNMDSPAAAPVVHGEL
ncbi:hypothetical protein IWQ60_001667 [Tieghemiomyces parasiticus]|uniref:Uncharacterized protein n=1 Tax=Tieghemiomyces parasiticus TaxID=78921 RepID=A0A9W8E1P6_9FUNG|nr:hypothetical protein IWQ60_001667 [Tieghemiomyces parasiticus]